MTAHPWGTSVSSRVSKSGYMASADLVYTNPVGEIQAQGQYTPATTANLWGGASSGKKLLADTTGNGFFGFTFPDSPRSTMQQSGVAADGALIIYFAGTGTAAPTSGTQQSSTIQIEMESATAAA